MNLLIANRGEIAVRIIRTAKSEGHRTIAVFSEADADAPHVRAADTAQPIGPAAPRESYLNIPKIIEAARAAGADAVHPGYGFLSENAEFAEACNAAGIVFVGPAAESIRLMGDKSAAKRRMEAAGIPVLAGYQGLEQSDERLLEEAQRIGFPLMVKAAAGGGGKGMRLVEEITELPSALAAARREAQGAFGSDVLILERALRTPRHIEVQVLADTHGKVIAVGERDCSIQRRHQKVIEEAPSPALDDGLRAEMCKAAVQAAEEIDYVGAGTVEFLLDSDQSFAFLEMNTRLQVEHAVTEMTTGLDLVSWQLRIAAGELLAFAQSDIDMSGHAIEARLYAEDADYLPSSGCVERWEAPSGAGVRVDAGIATGFHVGPDYDPLLAKIIAHGATREEARRRLLAALERTTLLGITSNRTFLAAVLRDERFVSGEFSTSFLSDKMPGTASATGPHLGAAAAALQTDRENRFHARSPGLAGWTNGAERQSTMRVEVGSASHEVRLTRRPDTLEIAVDGELQDAIPEPRKVLITAKDRVMVAFDSLDLDLRDVSLAPPSPTDEAASGSLVSPFHGTVAAVYTKTGDAVQAGDRLVVVEAMKMEHPMHAAVAGTVTGVVAEGLQVAAGDVLLQIESEEQAS
jgi:geranyl-CoA carboxylase alpha subunit